jgi:hypothetical protein
MPSLPPSPTCSSILMLHCTESAQDVNQRSTVVLRYFDLYYSTSHCINMRIVCIPPYYVVIKLFTAHLGDISKKDCSTVHWLTAETLFRALVSPRGILDGQSDIGSSFRVLRFYPVNITPSSFHTHVLSRGRIIGPLAGPSGRAVWGVGFHHWYAETVGSNAA